MSKTNEQLERVVSGVKGLDEVLRGGFIQGGLYIVEGAPGTGKTILGNQICFNQIRSGKTVLYVTLIAETVARMLLNLRGMKFFDEGAVGTGIFYISGFSALKNEGLTGLLHLLRREVAARRASVVVLDGFATATEFANSPRDLKVFVQQLQTQSDAADSTVFLLTNPIEARPSSEETMVDGIIGLSSSLQGSSALREFYVRKFRGSSYLEGVHNYKIVGDGINIYPRMETLVRDAPTDNGVVARVTSGIPRLDEMLGGGLPSRSMTMLVGPSGTGKTTMGFQFLSQASAAEPGLFFGFYETPARIRSKARMFPSFEKALDRGGVELLWQQPTEWLLDELADRLLQAVNRRKVRRLFIDGLAGFKRALGARQIEPFFAALVEELRGGGVTTICTAEVMEIIGPTVTTPLAGMSDVTDNHIIFRFIEAGATVHRIISLLKVRDSSFDSGLREFSISAEGVQIAEDSLGAELILSSLGPRARQTDISVGKK
jgi:circadian clock protein KaiC